MRRKNGDRHMKKKCYNGHNQVKEEESYIQQVMKDRNLNDGGWTDWGAKVSKNDSSMSK